MFVRVAPRAVSRVQFRSYAKKDLESLHTQGQQIIKDAKAEVPSVGDVKSQAATEKGKLLEQYGELYNTLDKQTSARDIFSGEYYKMNARQQEAHRAFVNAQNAALAPVLEKYGADLRPGALG